MPDPLQIGPRYPLVGHYRSWGLDNIDVDPLRDAVAALRAEGDRSVTLAGQLRQAIGERVALLRRTRNDGRPFPRRPGPLTPGRPCLVIVGDDMEPTEPRPAQQRFAFLSEEG